jgi:hypothetical protein
MKATAKWDLLVGTWEEQFRYEYNDRPIVGHVIIFRYRIPSAPLVLGWSGST